MAPHQIAPNPAHGRESLRLHSQRAFITYEQTVITSAALKTALQQSNIGVFLAPEFGLSRPQCHSPVFSGLKAEAGYSVTELVYYSTLKLRGSCLCWYAHVGFGSQQSVLAGDRQGGGLGGREGGREGGGGGGADLILLSSGAAALSLCLPRCCCTCLLFILRSEKEESGWWERATFSPL